MDFPDTGLPQDMDVESAYGLLDTPDNGDRVKIVRNIIGGLPKSAAATLAAASLLRLYLNDRVRAGADRVRECRDVVSSLFGGAVVGTLDRIMAADMNAVLAGDTKTLTGADDAAKIYAMGHVLFLLEDKLDKTFHGDRRMTEHGGDVTPVGEFDLRSGSGQIARAADILQAGRGASPALEGRLDTCIARAMRIVEAGRSAQDRQAQADKELSRLLIGVTDFNDMMRRGVYFAVMEKDTGRKPDPRSISRHLDEIAAMAALHRHAAPRLRDTFERAMTEARQLLARHLPPPAGPAPGLS